MDIFKHAKNKRGAMGLDSVPALAITLVIVAVVFVVGYLIMAGLSSSTTNAKALGAVGNLTLAMDNVVTFAPTWGVVIGASVILLIVIGGLYFFISRKDGGEGPGF